MKNLGPNIFKDDGPWIPCQDGNENTCPSNSHRKLIRYVDTPPSGCITLHEASAKNELIFKTNLFANVKARIFHDTHWNNSERLFLKNIRKMSENYFKILEMDKNVRKSGTKMTSSIKTKF